MCIILCMLLCMQNFLQSRIHSLSVLCFFRRYEASSIYSTEVIFNCTFNFFLLPLRVAIFCPPCIPNGSKHILYWLYIMHFEHARLTTHLMWISWTERRNWWQCFVVFCMHNANLPVSSSLRIFAFERKSDVKGFLLARCYASVVCSNLKFSVGFRENEIGTGSLLSLDR